MEHLTRRRFLQTSTLSLAGLASGCAAPVAGPDREVETEPGWATFRGDRYNTGYVPGGPDVSSDPEVKWSFEAGGDFWGSPVVGDGTVFVGNADAHLYAIDRETGEPAWTFEAGHRIEGTPAYDDGTVYVGAYDGRLHALDAERGEVRWTLDAEGAIRSSPKVVEDTVYVGTGCHNLACEWYIDEPVTTGQVYAVDAATGEPEWVFDVPDEVVSTPAVGEDTVYIGSSDATLYALDRTDGTERWQFGARDWIWSAPTLSFGTVFFADWDGFVYAVDAASGEPEWTYRTFGAYVSGSTAVDEESVYFGYTPPNAPPDPIRKDAKVFALDREDGSERWTYTTDALEIGSSPAITDDRLYVGSHSQLDEGGTGVYALTKGGTERWFFEVPERGVGSSPALVDGELYFGGADDRLYALR